MSGLSRDLWLQPVPRSGGPNVIVGCVPPLNGRSSHLIEAAKRGRLDQMIFFSAPLTTRAPPGRSARRPAERRPGRTTGRTPADDPGAADDRPTSDNTGVPGQLLSSTIFREHPLGPRSWNQIQMVRKSFGLYKIVCGIQTRLFLE